MTESQLRKVWDKTNGHCHFCGDTVAFKKRGWVAGNRAGYWEVDHVIQKGKGGDKSAENCLPACTSCNRLRWHRTGADLRELLFMGLLALSEVKRATIIGKRLEEKKKHRLLLNKSRRVG